MKRLMALVGLSVLSTAAHGADRIIPLDLTLIQEIKVEGKIQAWLLYKICLDGVAYYVMPTATAPTSIAPVFNKDGKPELCQGNLIKK